MLTKKNWLLQTLLLYAPFGIEFAAFPLFMLIRPEWVGGLLFWVCYTYLFYGAAIFLHTRWRKRNGVKMDWHIGKGCARWFIVALIIGASFQHLEALLFSYSQTPMLVRELLSALRTEPLWMGIGSFVLQNIYYAFEFTLVTCIVVSAQAAGEALGGSKGVPWGGLFLGLTWGIGHAFTKGVFVYGLASMVLSIVAGYAYIKLERKPNIVWVLIAAAYLL